MMRPGQRLTSSFGSTSLQGFLLLLFLPSLRFLSRLVYFLFLMLVLILLACVAHVRLLIIVETAL